MNGNQMMINSNSMPSTTSNVHLAKQIKTYHHDLIQDIAYDFFGKRVATASLDQFVKIWNIKDNNEWEFKEEIKVSLFVCFNTTEAINLFFFYYLQVNPGLYKVAWAHPEFGQILASW